MSLWFLCSLLCSGCWASIHVLIAYPLEKCLLQSFAYFSFRCLSSFCWLTWDEAFIDSKHENLGRYMTCKYVLTLCGLSFHFLIVSFDAQKIWILVKSKLSAFAFVARGVIFEKLLFNPRSWNERRFHLCDVWIFIPRVVVYACSFCQYQSC